MKKFSLSVLFLFTAMLCQAQAVFINEIHYDDALTDADEGVEIAGPTNTDLTNWQLIPYNGNNGEMYNPTNLSGVISDQSNGYGTIFFPIVGLQNGAPDGIALFDGTSVVQFLSYEGSFSATDGPAMGMTSIDIGVVEGNTTPDGRSLQLMGTGVMYSDFTWTGPIDATRDAVNTGQMFPPDPSPVITCPMDVTVNVTPTMCGAIATYNDATATDPDMDLDTVVQIDPDPNVLGSGDEFPVGTTPITFRATDMAGNTADCTFNVIVVDNEAPVIICQDENVVVTLDEDGLASLDASDLLMNVTDNCTNYTITVGEEPSSCEFSAPSNNENGSSCLWDVSRIVANDILVGSENMLLQTLTPRLLVGLDGSGVDVELLDFFLYEDNGGIPGNTITAEYALIPASQTLVGTSPNGFQAWDVEIDITDILLTADTTYWIGLSVKENDPSNMINGTFWENTAGNTIGYGEGFLDGFEVSVDPNLEGVYTFTGICGNLDGPLDVLDLDCSMLGENEIEVTVTDDSGNTATCTTTVEVIDNIAPVLECQDITIELDENGQAEITPEDLLTALPDTHEIMIVGSNANPPVEGFTDFTVNITEAATVTFDWDYISNDNIPGKDSFGYLLNGLYTDLTDPSMGNQNGSSSVDVAPGDEFGFRSYSEDNFGGNNVITIDNFTPGFEGQFSQDNWELTLLQSGGDAFFVTIPGESLSYDNCGFDTLEVDVQNVSCDDIGTTITVTVTATDVSGNTSFCTSEVTVVDNLGPVVTCIDDFTEEIPENTLYVLPDFWASGDITATDNCTDPVTTTSQVPAPDTELNVGDHTITLCAEDEYGNETCCEFVITVEFELGINDNKLDAGITMYPNPAQNQLTIANSTNINLEKAIIYDINGRIINTIDLSNMLQEKSINVSNLATGVYMVQIKGDNASTVKRFIKK